MKRFAVILMALVMMFAVCAIAEEIVEETTITEEEISYPMYVANCGTVRVRVDADLTSRTVTKVMCNMEVTVTGEAVENGFNTFYPVTVNGKSGYIMADYLAEERAMSNLTGVALVNTVVHVAPSFDAETVKKPFLTKGRIPAFAFFKVEYIVGGEWAYVTAKLHGQREEIGFVNVGDITFADPTILNSTMYVLYRDIDTWNDIR